DRQDSGDVGCGFLEHLKPLATHRRLVTSKTGDIAARVARLDTKPPPTGSPTPTKTIGTLPAIGLSTASARFVYVTATSGERAMSSAAQARICSGCPFHQCTCAPLFSLPRHPSPPGRPQKASGH